VAKSLTSILSQIERLQKEAAAIQLEVVARIRKDIAKYGLTAEQLFGATTATGSGRSKVATRKTAKAPKYADGAGNTWGGMGKRPDWLRQALAAGKALEDFLVGTTGASVLASSKATKARNVKAKATPRRKGPAAKPVRAKAAAPAKSRKSGTKPAAAAEAN